MTEVIDNPTRLTSRTTVSEAAGVNTSAPSLADLVVAMNGVPTTNGWDIVTSYSEKQLNTFLASQYNAGRLAKQVKLSTTRESPLDGTKFTVAYNINFDSPKLSFVQGVSGSASLVMPIGSGSGYTVTPQGHSTPTRTGDIPAGKYSLKAVVPLAAINGDTGAVTEHGSVVTFSAGNPQSNHVIIHFKNSKGALFTIEPAPTTGDKDLLETYFLAIIKDYFQTKINEIDYALAGVNNNKPASGVTLFTPKSFVFASSGTQNTGVLSFYILTEQSGHPAGNASPSFQPGDKAISPVPQKFTASIILSNALVQNMFLKPQLEKSGYSVSFQTVTRGIKAQLKKDISVIAEGKSSNYIFGSNSYSGLDISMSKYPMNLTIADGKATTDWTGEGSSSWSSTEVTPSGGAAQYGEVKITIDMEKGPLAMSVDNNGLTIPGFIYSRSDFKVHTKSKSCSFWERLIGCETMVPGFYSDGMKLKIPAINFSLHGFDYFRETNLLAPGKEMISVSSSAGVSTPHDFVIVGTEATS